MKATLIGTESHTALFRISMVLSIITIVYNILEGLISTFFGASDGTLTLFGFGIDSFVEVVSGFGIAHMIWRINSHPVEKRDKFEIRALMITGISFYILTGGLIIGSISSIITGANPTTTLAGIIIAGISIVTMYILYRLKLETGYKLNSAPIISDARCTKTCFYLSFILLASSLIYELFTIPYADAVGSLGIAWYAYKEGKEAFEKINSGNITCSDDCECN